MWGHAEICRRRRRRVWVKCGMCNALTLCGLTSFGKSGGTILLSGFALLESCTCCFCIVETFVELDCFLIRIG